SIISAPSTAQFCIVNVRAKAWPSFAIRSASWSFDLAQSSFSSRSNDQEAERIAKNGQAFARTLTMQNCAVEGAEIIETHYLGKPTRYARENLLK
ncbi:MAG: hypothetical protein AAFR27_12970, partial [Pseudomonadota bacterium]